MSRIDTKGIGNKIQEERKRKKMTQEQLAELLGTNRVVISRIESGDRGFGLDYFVGIANALRVSADYLLADSLEYTGTASDEITVRRILEGCSPEEKSILTGTVAALSEILKNYTIK